MDAETLRVELGRQHWEHRADGYWLHDAAVDAHQMASLMREAGARLMTITATPDADGETRLAYHWDLNGTIHTVSILTHEAQTASISAICPAANWIEREIHDYFGVQFEGHDDLTPLVLRPGDNPGLFHWNGQKGGDR